MNDDAPCPDAVFQQAHGPHAWDPVGAGEVACPGHPADPGADRRRALAFNAIAPALKAHDQWLPLTVRKAVADAVLAAIDEQPSTICGASTRGALGGPLGPCVLRHQHDGPVHQDATGAQWTPAVDGKAAAEASEPPRFTWAESLAAHLKQGQVVVPITGPDGSDADLWIDRAEAGVLHAMLGDSLGSLTTP